MLLLLLHRHWQNIVHTESTEGTTARVAGGLSAKGASREHRRCNHCRKIMAKPLVITIIRSCCNTDSEQLHHCCHLTNNFGLCRTFPVVLNEPGHVPPKLPVLLGGGGSCLTDRQTHRQPNISNNRLSFALYACNAA